MQSQISFAARKWGHEKVSSLTSEGYNLMYNFTDTDQFTTMAKLKHSNGNVVVVMIVAKSGQVYKNGKLVHEERLK